MKRGEAWNIHHLLFIRREWLYSEDMMARELCKGLTLKMPVIWHNKLHMDIRPIQKLTGPTLRKVYDAMRMTGDVIYDAICLSEIADHYGAHKLSTGLAEEVAYIKEWLRSEE